MSDNIKSVLKPTIHNEIEDVFKKQQAIWKSVNLSSKIFQKMF